MSVAISSILVFQKARSLRSLTLLSASISFSFLLLSLLPLLSLLLARLYLAASTHTPRAFAKRTNPSSPKKLIPPPSLQVPALPSFLIDFATWLWNKLGATMNRPYIFASLSFVVFVETLLILLSFMFLRRATSKARLCAFLMDQVGGERAKKMRIMLV